MEYILDEEQRMIINMVKDFCQQSIAPVVEELNKKEQFPTEILNKMGELGLLGPLVPEQYGGANIPMTTYARMIEEISKVCASVGVTVAVHTSVGTWPIVEFGTDEQKQKYLPKLATGEWIGAFALTEADAGSDAGALKTVAVRDGDDWILNGSKVFITNAAHADVTMVAAKTDTSAGLKGISMFIVPRGTPGLEYGDKEEKLGLHASDTSSLSFTDMRLPADALLGAEGQGFSICMKDLDSSRIGIGAQSVGIAQAAIDCAAKYAKEREQFGRNIGAFQAIQFMLADMATATDAARLLVLRAAERKDLKLPFSRESSMAKLFASDTAMEVTTKAIQILGGNGYTVDYPAERYFRDAKACQIYEGTNQIQRIVIAREELKKA